MGDLCRDRRGGGAAGVLDRDVDGDAAPEPPDPGPAAREGALRYLGQHPAPSGRRRIVGSPDTVRAGIEEVVAAYRADEAIVVTITHDHGARRRSYELIAEAFELARDLDDLRVVDL
jgi:alkanesulfonate monooxygenase SsuD/methylene tetrahydromethanopterin reductase-like flavin-dependent oxidoreductase (luciferase family)